MNEFNFKFVVVFHVLQSKNFPYYVSTLGNAFWNSQKIFRAIYSTNFKEWKPLVWLSIKGDYGFESDDKEDDVEESDEANPALSNISKYIDETDEAKPGPSKNLSGTDQYSHSSSSKLEKKIDHIIQMLTKEREMSSIKEVFKCTICMETCSNLMTACTHSKGCGRLLGCFTCLYKLEKCPFCLTDLCPGMERKPLIIPGLDSILGVSQISLVSALSQVGVQSISSDDEDDDLLMESLPLPDSISSTRASAEQNTD